MIRALNPLFPHQGHRRRPRDVKFRLFRRISTDQTRLPAADDDRPRWDAPDHWVEREWEF